MKAVVIFGAPGSGKSTQARLIADKEGLFFFDTGRFVDALVHNPANAKNKIIQRERLLYDTGKLMTPSFVTREVIKKTKQISKMGSGIILSGSPRTMEEAFGRDGKGGLVKTFEELYGKKNVFFFSLDVKEKNARVRNASRQLCSVCKAPIVGIFNLPITQCPFCGGKLIRRFDDNPKIFSTRIAEYQERTRPILNELHKRRFTVHHINGDVLPFKVFASIISRLS